MYEPSCDCIGVSYRTCTKCNQAEHNYIEKLGHTMVDVYTMVNTCTQHTVMTKCSVCNVAFVEDREIEADHNYIDGTCSICGDITIVATPDEYFTFTLLEDGTYSVEAKDKNNMPNEVVIPSTYNGKAITVIGYRAFDWCGSLASIIIPDSITSIGSSAFAYCDSLVSITIPDSVTSIGSSAFAHCDSLTSVEIPDSVTSIGDSTFHSCDSLASVEIPDSVTSIGDYAFRACSNITSITIPDSVTSIGQYAFVDCDSLTSVVIPDSITNISAGTFYGCSSLTEIIIPDSVTSIGNSAFSGCDSLTSVVIPDSVMTIGSSPFTGCNLDTIVCESPNYTVKGGCLIENGTKVIAGTNNSVIPHGITSIGDGAFSGRRKLTNIIIPDSVTSIGSSAFEDCSSLASITIPDSVTIILGTTPFLGCTNLTDITVDENNEYYKSIDGNLYHNWNSKTLILMQYAIGKEDTTFEIPDGVTEIGYSAFAGCDNLTSVIIPDSVTSIGLWAFSDCTSLTSVVIPDNVTSIGQDAFSGCSSLASVTIGKAVTSIGYEAFSGCSKLTDVYYIGTEEEWAKISIDSSNGYLINATRYYYSETQPVEEGNFWHWVDGEPTVWEVHIHNAVIDPAVEPTCTTTGLTEGSHCSDCGEVLAEQEIADIIDHNYVNGNCEFCGITSLEYFYFNLLDDGTYSVEAKNIDNMPSEVVIPLTYKGKDVTSIGYHAFYECTSLASITIPDSVTSIGNSAFWGCINLKSVVIGDSVTSIGDGVFANCNSLTNVVVPDSVTSIGSGTFYNTAYYNDESNWVDDVLYIGNHLIEVQYTISGEYVIKDGTLTIADGAFSPINSLTSVKIPDSVTYIGDGEFSGCHRLTSIGVDENNQYYKSIDGNLYSKDETTTLIRYLIGKKDKSFIIPDIVTSIGNYAFYGCGRLPSVTIPDSVTSIGNYAFFNCSSLTIIDIPDSVTSIGEYAFYGCSSLAEIVIPDNVTSINSGAFFDTAYYNDENNWVDGVLYIGNHLIDVRDDISGECKIKDGTLAIPNSAFSFSDNLIRVVIPDSVTSIGDGAFWGCDNLTTVVIGDIVTSIDNYAFYGCSGLTDVYYTGTEEEWAKISIGSNNTYLTNATIHYNYVPVE